MKSVGMGSWSYSSPHGGVRSVGVGIWSYSSPHGGVRSVGWVVGRIVALMEV